MILPTICMNGSSPEEMEIIYRAMMMSVKEARLELNKYYPHGRDYQLAPEGEYEQARFEHRARIVVLESVEKELREIALHCHAQKIERKKKMQ